MELRRYVGMFWKWLWLMVLCAALAGAGAYVISKQVVVLYGATCTMLINPANSNIQDYSSLMTSERLAMTYVELLTKRPVMEEVVRALGLEVDPESLAGQIAVSVVRDTQLITLRVVDEDPARAKDIANTVPVVFAQINEEMQLSRYKSSKDNLTRQLEEVSADISSTLTSLDSLRDQPDASEAEITRLEDALLQYRTTYSNLVRYFEEVRVQEAGALDTVTVVEPAGAAIPISRRTFTNVLIAVMIGGMVAVGIMLLVEYLDDTVKSPDDVERLVHLATLGIIVNFRRFSSNGQGPVTAARPKSSIAEGYRVLRTNVQFAAMGAGKPGTLLLVTSAQPREGKSTSIANVGVSLAQAGKRVLLVDADLRRPTLHEQFGLTNEVGLTSLLLERDADLERVVRDTGIEGLRVLTSGRCPANPAEVLSFPETAQLLERLKALADYVLLDSPPVLSVADASILAQKADGVLLIVEMGKTRTGAMQRSVAALQAVKARLMGVVINRVSAQPGSYYHDQYYNYSRYYDDEEGGGKKKSRSSPLARLLGRGGKKRPPAGHSGQAGIDSLHAAPSTADEAEPLRTVEPQPASGDERRSADGGEAPSSLEAQAGPGTEYRAAGTIEASVPGTAMGTVESPLGFSTRLTAGRASQSARAEQGGGGVPIAHVERASDTDALYLQGMAHYRRREWNQARESLLRVKQEEPARGGVDAILNDIDMLMRLDQLRVAGSAAVLERIPDVHETTAPTKRPQATRSRLPTRPLALIPVVLLVLAGAAALSIYQGWVRLPAAAPSARGYINQGRALFMIENYQASAGAFTKALELEPNNSDARLGAEKARQYIEIKSLYAEARALVDQNDCTRAVEKLEAVTAIDAWYKDAGVMLARCKRYSELDGLFAKALDSYNNSEWSKAASALASIRGRDATYRQAELKEMLFNAYLNDGRQRIAKAVTSTDILQAMGSLSSAAGLDPGSSTVQEERQLAALYSDGFMARSQGNWASAIASLSKIIGVRPDYAGGRCAQMVCECRLKLGAKYQAQGQLDLALSEYRAVVASAVCDSVEAREKEREIAQLLVSAQAAPQPTAAPTVQP